MVSIVTVLHAQITLSPSAGSKVGKAIAITQSTSLHFGTMSVPTGAVNIVLSTTNVRTASIPANVTLLSQSPLRQTATYTVYGDNNKHYLITLPTNNVVTISSGANHIHVNNFLPYTNSMGNGHFDGILNSLGEDTFSVGATLVLLSGQASGVYTGTFNVTVAYN